MDEMELDRNLPVPEDGEARTVPEAEEARSAPAEEPREEPEEKIIKDALPGLTASGKPYKIISDRYEAIEYALETCGEGDILLLLGKGHEDYQEIRGVKHPMDERVLIAEVLEELKQERS